MKLYFLRKYFALFVLLAVFSAAVAGVCHEGDKHAFQEKVDVIVVNSCPGQESPACPCEDKTDTGTCGSSCGCPCHSPLTAEPFRVGCSRDIAVLALFEPFTVFPQVYLPIFIPPQNLV